MLRDLVDLRCERRVGGRMAGPGVRQRTEQGGEVIVTERGAQLVAGRGRQTVQGPDLSGQGAQVGACSRAQPFTARSPVPAGFPRAR